MIFPINQNNMHWVCGAINLKDKRFEYYDSLSTEPDTHAFAVSVNQCPSDFMYNHSLLQVMREYLQKEHMDKKKKPIDLSDWEDYYDPVSSPRRALVALLTLPRICRKDRNKRTDSIAVSSPVKHWSIELEGSVTRGTT